MKQCNTEQQGEWTVVKLGGAGGVQIENGTMVIS